MKILDNLALFNGLCFPLTIFLPLYYGDVKSLLLKYLIHWTRGEFTSTKFRNTQTIKANMVIFATSNSTERLSKPLLSRFTVFEIPEYTYEEFEAISVRIIKKLPQNTIMQIASSVWKTGSRDIRDVLKIAKLCNPSDTEEDINRLISIHQKYRKTGREYN